MNLSTIRTIARYNSRLILRNWLLWILFVIILGSILFYQLSVQSTLANPVNDYAALASFIPYMNAYLFNILQVLPLLFLAGMMLKKGKRIDSQEVIFSRPESNMEYMLGVGWAFLRIFVCFAVVSLLMGVVINLYLSHNPFNGWLYLFYLVTLIVPTFVFVYGLSSLIMTWVSNRGMGLLAVILVLLLFFSVIGDFQRGVWDPFGMYLPNAFSEITGHPELGRYLLQRLGWLLLGVTLFGFAVIRFNRMPNTPLSWKRIAMVSAFGVLGLAALLTFHGIYRMQVKHRQEYRDAYVRYNGYKKVFLESEDIVYSQEGRKMNVRSALTVKNRNRLPVSEIVLFLNPSLKISQVLADGQPVKFQRDRQVVLVEKPLTSGMSCKIEIEYGGKIDESITYLSIDDNQYFDTRERGMFSCRFGKRYAFLERNFTLLTPEALWYPVTTAPVNPEMPLDIERQFTRFGLRVENPDSRTVVSQGERWVKEDVVEFRNRYNLNGISLCIGNYEQKSITVDSFRYEVNYFPGHEDVVQGYDDLKDQLPEFLNDIRYEMEDEFMREYLYDRFIIAEVPIAFTGYDRLERGGSDCVQPELALLPERIVETPLPDLNVEIERIEKESDRGMPLSPKLKMQIVSGSLLSEIDRLFSQDAIMINAKQNPIQNLLVRRSYASLTYSNPYKIRSLFYEQTLSVYSPEYPLMDAVWNNLVQLATHWTMDGFRGTRFNLTHHAALLFKDKSLKELLADPDMTRREFEIITKIKAEHLRNLLSLYGVESLQFDHFLLNYAKEHAFSNVSFQDFNAAFQEKFGVDWLTLLPDWYEGKGISGYYIRDFEVKEVVEKIEEELERRDSEWEGIYRVQANVYNSSEYDGIVYFVLASFSREPGFYVSKSKNASWKTPEITREYCYAIPAKTGKSIAFVTPPYTHEVTLVTNFALNQPAALEMRISPGESDIKQTTDTTTIFADRSSDYFLPPANEIIVDNQDPGFVINNLPIRNRLGKFLQEKVAPSYRNQYADHGKSWENTHSGYGEFVKDHIRKNGAEGKGSVEWHAPIEKEGLYEIFVYMTDAPKMSISLLQTGGYTPDERGRSENRPEVFYYYAVSHSGGVAEVALNVSIPGKQQWLSLGEYQLTKGDHYVTLSDKSDIPDLWIYADAVKWVRLD